MNHNRHYHSVVLSAVPAGCERALDVGCGLGELTRALSDRVARVTGIDRDERSIEIARKRSESHSERVQYIAGDFLTVPFEPESFDVVTAVASLHHMDTTPAVTRMRDLLRPGGVLAVIGLASRGSPLDLAVEVPAIVANRLHQLSGAATYEAYRPPVMAPLRCSYQQMRALLCRMLPGARYRRHLYWRYSLVWTKPSRALPGQ